MQKLVSFLEKSVQWIALGLACVFLLLCVYWYVLTPPATQKVGAQLVTPSEIDDLTSNGPVATIKNDIKNGKQEKIEVTDVLGPWKQQMLSPAANAVVFVDPIHSVGSRVNLGGGITNANPDLVTAVASLPKATPLSAQSGMSVVDPLPGPNGQAVQGAAQFNVLWASAAFTISAKDLKDAFAKPLEGKPTDYSKFYRTAYLNIELQRQRATGHDGAGNPIFPDGNTGIETVTTAKVNQTEIQPLPDAKAEQNTKASFAQWAESNEMSIREPKFYTVKAGSPWNAPVLPGHTPAPGTPAPAPAAAQPARIGAAPPAGVNPAAAGQGNQVGGIDPLTLADDQLVWAHDDTVEAGHSYRYRVIYHMKNPLFALQNIADPKIIDQLDIASPPSEWTAAVTIPQDVKYWVTGLQRNGSVLTDVFKWDLGIWKKASMPLAPGDTVPGTDQIIVDVHPGSRPKDQYVLLADASGDVVKHFPSDDRINPEKKDLEEKLNPNVANPPANPPRGGTGGNPPPPPARGGTGRTTAMPPR